MEAGSFWITARSVWCFHGRPNRHDHSLVHAVIAGNAGGQIQDVNTSLSRKEHRVTNLHRRCWTWFGVRTDTWVFKWERDFLADNIESSTINASCLPEERVEDFPDRRSRYSIFAAYGGCSVPVEARDHTRYAIEIE